MKAMNRFYEIPIEELKRIDSEWETRRMNADVTKALIHVETLDELIAGINAGVMTLSDNGSVSEQIVAYPIYSGKKLEALLMSDEWIPKGGAL